MPPMPPMTYAHSRPHSGEMLGPRVASGREGAGRPSPAPCPQAVLWACALGSLTEVGLATPAVPRGLGGADRWRCSVGSRAHHHGTSLLAGLCPDFKCVARLLGGQEPHCPLQLLPLGPLWLPCISLGFYWSVSCSWTGAQTGVSRGVSFDKQDASPNQHPHREARYNQAPSWALWPRPK